MVVLPAPPCHWIGRRATRSLSPRVIKCRWVHAPYLQRVPNQLPHYGGLNCFFSFCEVSKSCVGRCFFCRSCFHLHLRLFSAPLPLVYYWCTFKRQCAASRYSARHGGKHDQNQNVYCPFKQKTGVDESCWVDMLG